MDLRDRIRNGEPIAAAWVSIGHPAVAEILANLDFDVVFIDGEHSPISTETIENLVRAVETADGPKPIVRVPWNDPVKIKRVLDTGAAGVMTPMVESEKEAQSLVDATRYPPEGARGVAPARASRYGLSFEDYLEDANDSLVTVAQIETKAGVENASAIATIPELDSLFVGPADLSANYGHPGAPDTKAVDEAIDRILDATEGTETAVGTIVTDPDDIPQWIDRGIDYLVVGIDAAFLADGAIEARNAYERALTR